MDCLHKIIADAIANPNATYLTPSEALSQAIEAAYKWSDTNMPRESLIALCGSPEAKVEFTKVSHAVMQHARYSKSGTASQAALLINRLFSGCIALLPFNDRKLAAFCLEALDKSSSWIEAHSEEVKAYHSKQNLKEGDVFITYNYQHNYHSVYWWHGETCSDVGMVWNCKALSWDMLDEWFVNDFDKVVHVLCNIPIDKPNGIIQAMEDGVKWIEANSH
ncbi:hypothetical protein KK000_14560 [Enterobacter hormaechei subsp. xiangfangensis]|uniref:hypothetical protein n=1 Tax=Enterobacter hormaechei TaxID=158836 RepID=UPI001056A470|nr:hypothetical protein [Enterobacter hormaechei]MBT1773455.1 hypothetical protein [Enterobacter hormaechei subsp. xiangfangensis]MDN4964900.1 hypothetical protein [Enterobacter hormaechei]MDO6155175.1 hypothetical protein [Enterobacter hormaechei]